MKRVLINLVDNAIEATDKRGTVVISTEFDRAQGRVRLGVADDGPGIPAQDRDKLFVPHFSTKRRGSGLGLAIVSRIVQEHQGVIRVEENRPRGARFVVELPGMKRDRRESVADTTGRVVGDGRCVNRS